ncbi:MAG: RNA polymerase sigma factor [Chthoniobacterales bacterium]
MKIDLDEQQITSALLGDQQAQFKAVTRAYERYADPLASYIREKVAPTLDTHELTTAVNDVFIELARKAKLGQLKENGSLVALLFKMARANAIDQWRSKRRWEMRHISESDVVATEGGAGNDLSGDEKLIAHVARRLAEAPEIAAVWKTLTLRRTAADEVAANEVIRQFKVWLSGLPRLQRKVAESMAFHFGDATDEEICDEIAKSDVRPPVSSVKSARAQIREKFTALMNHQERGTQK